MRCESSSLDVTSTKTQTPEAMPSSGRSLPISYVISMQVKNGAHRKLKSVCPEHFQPRENDFHKSKNCLTNSLECFLGNLARKFDEVGGKVKARSFTAAVWSCDHKILKAGLGKVRVIRFSKRERERLKTVVIITKNIPLTVFSLLCPLINSANVNNEHLFAFNCWIVQ